MSAAILNLCECCHEDAPELPGYCPQLGALCRECMEGAINGQNSFFKKGVSGIFTGECGDNDFPWKGEPK